MTTDIASLKDYLKKLQRIINFEAYFSFSSYRLVKKNKIDDILCCIYATLPDSYKRCLKNKTDAIKYKSVASYNMLTIALAKKFVFDKDTIVINVSDAIKYLNAITQTIEKDIEKIDSLDD